MGVVIDLAGQTAWVTGGASGIGHAIVATLLSAGARVVSLDISYAADEQRAGVTCVRLDVRDPAAVNRIAGELAARGLAADILVNNAGITRDQVVWKLGDEAWRDVIEVNLGGAFHLTRACAPQMRERSRGAIVNISSINGIRGKFGQSNYAASKGGLIAFTRSVAKELARFGVRVNAIAPGLVETPMTQQLPAEVLATARAETLLGRFGRPEDVAHAVLFLVSPLASHITGHLLVVDGGQSV